MDLELVSVHQVKGCGAVKVHQGAVDHNGPEFLPVVLDERGFGHMHMSAARYISVALGSYRIGPIYCHWIRNPLQGLLGRPCYGFNGLSTLIVIADAL